MDRRIKVLHIIGALNLGGAETMAVNLFRNIDRERFQFDFFLSGNSGGFYEPEVLALGGRIFNVGRRRKHLLRYCTELYRLIRREGYDVIQIHATDAQDGLPALVAHLAGARRICMFSHNSAGQSPGRQKLMRAVFNRYVSDKQACSDLAAAWMYGKEACHARIIPLPIDCAGCRYDAQTALEKRRRYGLEGCRVIGHIGRFQAQKNHKRLLRIFRCVADRDADCRLVLIGGGHLEQEIDRQIQELGLEDKVLRLGQIGQAYRELSLFDMLLLPSLYEGFPTVLLEAQANGLPSVASSTITPTVALTDLVQFVGLEEPDEAWAERICAVPAGRGDTEGYNARIAKDYDIQAVTELFAEIYGGR